MTDRVNQAKERYVERLENIAERREEQGAAHTTGAIAASGRMVLDPVARNIDAPRDPDVLMCTHVVEKTRQRGGASESSLGRPIIFVKSICFILVSIL